MSKVLVTGGTGFIGSHLAEHLMSGGSMVTVLSSGDPHRIRGKDIRFIRGSVLDSELIDKEVKRTDVVYHLAAVASVSRVLADPVTAMNTNVLGTETVLRACAEHDKRVVFASSAEVYGYAERMAEDEDLVLGPVTPRWSYAAAKLAGEHFAMAYAAGGLHVSIVRYFNCYGPEDTLSVVSTFMQRALSGDPIILHDDGKQTRSFTYVSDIVRGTVRAAMPVAIGKTFNIGSDKETTIALLAQTISRMSDRGIHIKHESSRSAYGTAFQPIQRSVPDITLAQNVLDWKPLVNLEDGLRRTMAWWMHK